jgi:hypothetical protein
MNPNLGLSIPVPSFATWCNEGELTAGEGKAEALVESVPSL